MDFSKEEYLNIFIEHLQEFVRDVASIFPHDNNINLLKESIIFTSNINKEKCIKCWSKYVIDNFRKEIEANNYNFFIENNYNDYITHRKKDIILDKINEIRYSVKQMSETNKINALKYVENLTKLCDLYNS